ncbi:protein of unknown function [Shewanella benthica]|uniref:Uncharacterized protein n=1 Tax=Shewanella benthica TaxID=43661 RepID=A0A330LWY0_9GAMM|nr:hypothetical protein [Shewanella benthica]SQH74756.1 protein of unknown function [Shewanella benthica]
MALQFNRSRLAYLALLLLVFYASKQSSAQLFTTLDNYTDELFIGGAIVI